MSEATEAGLPGTMSESDAELAEQFYTALQAAATHTDRAEQAASFRVGVSDLGYCSERTKRMLNHEVPEDTDMLLAWIGTVLGAGVEEALAKHLDTEVLLQQQVSVPLKGERRTFDVPGHPDIILPEWGYVLDGKTSYGLRLAERVGVDQQKQFQRHCYGYGAWLEGFFGALPMEDVRVGNIWLDRSGKTKRLHVQTEPLDMEVVEAAGRWVDEVIYAVVNRQEAQKEPPREVCFATCGFYRVCREPETDVSGLIRDPWILEAVRMYTEGLRREKDGRAMKDEAKAALMGTTGSTGEYTVRWIEVDEVTVKEIKRAAHRRLDVRRLK